MIVRKVRNNFEPNTLQHHLSGFSRVEIKLRSIATGSKNITIINYSYLLMQPRKVTFDRSNYIANQLT